jgi:hypothetical protein
MNDERENKGKGSETFETVRQRSQIRVLRIHGEIWYIQVVNSIKQNENPGKEPSSISVNNHILLHIQFVASLCFFMISTLYKCTNRCIHLWCTSLWKFWLEGLNMYQKASTYDRRSQLIIITGSVVLLASIVSILVVRSNLSIKLYHPTTSLSRNLFVMQGNSWNCTTKYTKWTRCCTGEKWFLLQF